MRQKLVYILVGIALLVGLVALPPAPVSKHFVIQTKTMILTL